MQSKSSNNNGKPIRVGKYIVGYVRGDTFYKTVSGSKHFKRTPAGIANDVSVVADAINAGASWVEVTDRETGRIYTATLDLIKEKGIYFNEGFGNQINLFFEHWTVTLDQNSKTAKRGEVKRESGNRQRVHNPHGVSLVSPRQLVFKGML